MEAVEAGGAESPYDVVLMDMRMPVMGGIEATRLIRGLQNGGNLPIIAFTADTMSEDRERVFEAGANDLLAKPIDKQRLFEALQDVARGHGAPDDDATSGQSVTLAWQPPACRLPDPAPPAALPGPPRPLTAWPFYPR